LNELPRFKAHPEGSIVRHAAAGPPLNFMYTSANGIPASGPTASPSTMTVHHLADGDAGAHQSVRDMRGLVDRALKSPQVYTLARAIVQHVTPFDSLGEIRALYAWVLQNIRFTMGVIGKQSLQSADATLALRAGQCTDLSILLAALVMSVGYPARFVAVATDPQAPDQFSHIYPEAELAGEWIPLDAARANAQFGRAPDRVYRSQTFRILDAVGNMPRLGNGSSTLQDIAGVIQAAGAGVAQGLAAANSQEPYLLINGQYVANPSYTGPPVTSPYLATGTLLSQIMPLLAIGFGAWLLLRLTK